jgi:hypothetical protein
LRPADLSGYEVCPWSTAACRKICVLEHKGNAVKFKGVRNGRDAKTIRFFEDRQAFLADLHKDLDKLERKAAEQGLKPVCRLNTASDIAWEKVDPTIFTRHPSIQFYDYTKGIKRCFGKLPDNYNLTYSFNEESDVDAVVQLLDNDGTVTVVFDAVYHPQRGDVRPLPESWTIPGTNRRFAVVNGDEYDPRIPELDGRGVIVGLHAKATSDVKVIEGARGGFVQTIPGGVVELAGVKLHRKVTLTVL